MFSWTIKYAHFFHRNIWCFIIMHKMFSFFHRSFDSFCFLSLHRDTLLIDGVHTCCSHMLGFAASVGLLLLLLLPQKCKKVDDKIDPFNVLFRYKFKVFLSSLHLREILNHDPVMYPGGTGISPDQMSLYINCTEVTHIYTNGSYQLVYQNSTPLFVHTKQVFYYLSDGYL